VTPARFVASGFGSGLLRPGPGTWGSLAAVVAGAGLLALWRPALPLAAVAAYLGGLWAVRKAAAEDDPGWVTIDEFVGQWIAMLPLARPSWAGLAAAFVLFRAFDIVKPGPVRTAERIGGAQGVMADDVVAGGIVALLLWAVGSGWPGLLG
jgi:phosphatidylglycerophosphatase A